MSDGVAGRGDRRLWCEAWEDLRDMPGWSVPEGPGVVRLPANRAGRDLVVGDVHGSWALVEEALGRIGFDPAGDRLICAGDLVDRGRDSAGCAGWLARREVHAVRGNHDQMCLDAQGGGYPRTLWDHNGNAWWRGCRGEVRDEVVAALAPLPWALEVETEANGVVGVVHADVPVEVPWPEYTALLSAGDRQAATFAVWSREWTGYTAWAPGLRVEGVGWVVMGHTVLSRPARRQNRLYIDTGAAYDHPQAGRLTLAEITAPGVAVRQAGRGADPAQTVMAEHATPGRGGGT